MDTHRCVHVSALLGGLACPGDLMLGAGASAAAPSSHTRYHFCISTPCFSFLTVPMPHAFWLGPRVAVGAFPPPLRCTSESGVCTLETPVCQYTAAACLSQMHVRFLLSRLALQVYVSCICALAATDCGATDATARNRTRISSHAHGGTSITMMCVGIMLVCASQACGVMRWSTGVFCARRCAVGYMGRASVPVLSSGHITQATPDLFSTLTLSWVEPS